MNNYYLQAVNHFKTAMVPHTVRHSRFPITTRTYWMITIPVIIGNVFFYVFNMKRLGIFDPALNLEISLFNYTITMFVLCLPIGLLVGLIPYKGMRYREKRGAAIFFTFLVVQILIFLFSASTAIIIPKS
jgi:hypothetical protein